MVPIPEILAETPEIVASPGDQIVKSNNTEYWIDGRGTSFGAEAGDHLKSIGVVLQ